MNNQNTTRASVASWLQSLGYKNINHISLKIQNQTFYGCSYEFSGQYTRGMDAVSRGQKQEGESYQETRFYFVGDLPSPYQKNPNKTCFTQENITYYISCYSDIYSNKEHAPFGNSL